MGLFSNVESSVLIEFDSTDVEGSRLLSELKVYYKSFFDVSDKNLFELTNSKIDEFVNDRIVPTEAERRRLFNKKLSNKIVNNDTSIKLLNVPRRNTSKIPTAFKRKKAHKTVGAIRVIDEGAKKVF